MFFSGNKVLLITGGSGGIGKEIAYLFASHGVHVAFTYHRDSEKAQQLLRELEEKGVKCKAYCFDCSEYEHAQDLTNQVLRDFGSLDILINNAGIISDNLLVRMSESQWDKILAVNLKAVFSLTQAVIKSYMRSNGGVIVNVSSVMGICGNAGQSNYAASKGGMIAFTKSVALEMASRNIRVNAVAPGFIATEMTSKLNGDARQKWISKIPFKRVGHPQEVAKVCLFLASDMASYVSGQVLNVDGAMLT